MTRNTTSNINYLGINENFPVAGQDNDTQTFRDNFDTIKTSLRSAKEDIEDLLVNAARLDDNNDFLEKEISNAVLVNNKSKINNLGERPSITETSNVVEIDYEKSSYHILKATSNISLEFSNLPGDPALTETVLGYGKMTIELYGDGNARNIGFTTSAGTVLKKSSNFPALLQVTSATDPIFIEVWRHRENEIFMNYLGLFA